MSTIFLNGNIKDDAKCECGNCDWVGPAVATFAIQDAQDRLQPDAKVPVGECPECGALAYLQEPRDVYGHWGEHPGYPLEDWRLQVMNNETRLGYWEWVADCIEFDRDEAAACG